VGPNDVSIAQTQYALQLCESVYTTRCVAVCCSVLQCHAVCCSVLQSHAVCCRVLQRVALRCSVLQCVAVCCSVLQYQNTEGALPVPT